MDIAQEPLVAVLTPVKDASMHASSYFERLRSLTYTHRRLSIGLLEGDSQDSTYECFQHETEKARAVFHSAQIWKKDFGFRIPQGLPRWHPPIQEERRSVLARSRNHLLHYALGSADWVLWLDVDVIEFPSDIVEQLLAYDRDIVHPNCVLEYGGKSFDLNAWSKHGTKFMHDLRGGDELVRLDSVGGTLLFVRAECHRNGLVFPPYYYGRPNPAARPAILHRPPREPGEIETEGMALMAYDMGYECWGVPGLEIKHAPL